MPACRRQKAAAAAGYNFYPQGGFDLYTPLGYIKSMKEAIKKKAVRRLQILEGQIRGLQKMVQEEKYCVDILYQSLAAKEALSGVEDLILENHLATHAADQMRKGKSEKAVREILSIYKLSRKRN